MTSAVVERLSEALSSELRPPKRLLVSEWADRFRVIPAEGASEPGRWRTSRFPFLRRVMDLLSPTDPTQRVTVLKGAQLGFTEVGINFALYVADHAPAPTLFVQKTIDNMRRFSKQRLDRSIDSCLPLRGKITERRSRSKTNTTLMKSFPGGILILGGANSAASLRSMPIQNLVLDEEDSFVSDLEGEGSPSEIAIRRTANFPRRKIFRLSTPGIKETSTIEPNFEDGSRERYHVPCPECGGKQALFWPQFKWRDDDPDTVEYECAFCKARIPEHKKTWMLANGEWIAEDPGNAHKSFHISSLYSPLGFFSWADAAAMFIKATRTFDKNLLKVFVNTVLGETWTEAGRTIESSWVRKRKEPYATPAPEGVLLITAGVDVQEDRLEAEVVGWGENEETWSLAYEVLMGDTETSFVWDRLDALLAKTWKHASGIDVPIAASAVDSGHRAAVVYKYCRAREFRRIFAVKGFDGFGRGYVRRPQRRNDHGVWLFNAFVDEIKSKVYSQLQVDEAGPGYCHFPDRPEYGEAYFNGLTSERLVTSRKGGRATLRWELPKGRRNEPLDCRAYAYAALRILNVDLSALAARGGPVVPRGAVRPRHRARVLSRGAT